MGFIHNIFYTFEIATELENNGAIYVGQLPTNKIT